MVVIGSCTLLCLSICEVLKLQLSVMSLEELKSLHTTLFML